MQEAEAVSALSLLRREHLLGLFRAGGLKERLDAPEHNRLVDIPRELLPRRLASLHLS